MIRKIIKKILLFRLTFFKKINKNFYSQFGEDKILNELIPKNFINGFYVDVDVFIQKNTQTLIYYIKKGGEVLI